MQHVFWKKYDICGSFSNCKHQLPNSEGEKKAEEESWMRRIVWLENTRGSLWKWSAINIRESVGPRFKFYCDLFSVVHYPRRRGGRRRKRRKRSRKIFAATTSVSPLVFLHRTASSSQILLCRRLWIVVRLLSSLPRGLQPSNEKEKNQKKMKND